MMAYVYAGLVIAGVILYIALCIGGIAWGLDNDHPFIGFIPFLLLILLWLFGVFIWIAQELAEAGVGA
ncbi:hypothetical protein [Bifidobacterium simiiventris]|uniref:hypothetical protein n=1 Tax=Bifidobacterium simiiventris TaxID=2834434 RepID=UPI001C56CBBC|nr:hypothetical protein [Bifidobacterium simiiventris]MBW3077725.1 hypothetical protein [Bifidobacterium simiiventris]